MKACKGATQFVYRWCNLFKPTQMSFPFKKSFLMLKVIFPRGNKDTHRTVDRSGKTFLFIYFFIYTLLWALQCKYPFWQNVKTSCKNVMFFQAIDTRKSNSQYLHAAGHTHALFETGSSNFTFAEVCGGSRKSRK